MDRDNFLTRGACALDFLDLLFSILSTCDPIFESVLVLSVPSWAINEGDVRLRRLGFEQSESDLSLLSTSSWLRELVDPLRGFPHSDPESSLFLPSDEHAYLRQKLFEESDSDPLSSESSCSFSTLDWESDLLSEGLDLSKKEGQLEINTSCL